jgi:hypothetical protein
MGRNEKNVLEKIPIGSRFDSHKFGFVPNRAKPTEGERPKLERQRLRVRGPSTH